MAVWLCSSSAGSSADPVRLLVLGDSLTAGYGLARSDAFPAQLERALRADGLAITVIDAGVSGDTTAGGLARLPWVLGGRPEDQPDAVIVELGGNDMLRGIDPQITFAHLDALLTELKRRELPVLLAGMKAAPNLGAEYVQAFNAVFPRLTDKHGVALYPFFLDGVAGVAALNQADGIHPNARGVAEIVTRIAPAIKRVLAAAPESHRNPP